MAQIVLTTLNARYIHSAIGLRYLQANLHELQSSSVLLEYTISDQLTDIAEKILAHHPIIIGLAVYIWNGNECQQLVRILKAVAPEVLLVVGGPEVSHLPHRLDFSLADHVICGEGEESFYTLCQGVLGGANKEERVIQAAPPDLSRINLPYSLYTDQDVAHRIIYVEASRGCPFHCEFCLSSIDKTVRYFQVDHFLHELERLWQRGARNIKFIDRTFNLGSDRTEHILEFFLSKTPPYLVHFEVIPEHFPDSLQKKLAQFPPGTLQLEVGIQTLNQEVAQTIHRRLDMAKIQHNLQFLEQETNAHLHVDLIIGLPGETAESFGRNLNQLMQLTHAEIQLGVLKKLSGTTISRHDIQHQMTYLPYPPYEILSNDLIDFKTMQELKRLARFWDLVYNSGNFNQTVRLLWAEDHDVYEGFKQFSNWLYGATLTTWQISLKRMAELIFSYLTEQLTIPLDTAANTLASDILKIKGRSLPAIIAQNTTKKHGELQSQTIASPGKRQTKHLY